MSTAPESDFSLDLHFLPAWAQQSPDKNRYARFAGQDSERPDRGGDRSDRGPRPPRRDRPGGERPRGPQRAQAPRRDFERREPKPEAPLPEVSVTLLPDEKGVESLSRQIKMTGRAYPLFDIAQLVLQKPERYYLRLGVIKKAGDQIAQPLFLCALDDTLWLSEDEAVAHVLDKHFATFYRTERIPTDPPKGTYTFVAQCGMSGVILGPPNYHDYQVKLHKLHAERFPRIPFDVYKARVKIVRDEAVVKKWTEEQSWKTQYVCLNVPEPLTLGGREEVEKHFRATHLANMIKRVEEHTVNGAAVRALGPVALQRLARRAHEEQRRFPLKLVTTLSHQFAAHGLQFFKVNKTVTHVAVARPNYLDLEAIPVSDSVRRIIEFISRHPKCSRHQLIETLMPGPAPAAPLERGPNAPPATPAPPAEPTPEQTAVIADLHWLVHQGHVIEFANGMLDTARKPALRPPRQVAPASPAADVLPNSAPASTMVTEIADAQLTEPSDHGSAAPETVGAETAPVPSAESSSLKAAEPGTTSEPAAGVTTEAAPEASKEISPA